MVGVYCGSRGRGANPRHPSRTARLRPWQFLAKIAAQACTDAKNLAESRAAVHYGPTRERLHFASAADKGDSGTGQISRWLRSSSLSTRSRTEIRDQLAACGKIESRLRRLEQTDPDTATAPADRHRLGRLQALTGQHRAARSEIRRLERLADGLLDRCGTTLRDEPGIGTISAATLVCEVGDPRRFDRESKLARWCGTGPAARKTAEGKTRRQARPAHKRHPANRVTRRTRRDENTRKQPHKPAARQRSVRHLPILLLSSSSSTRWKRPV